MKTANRITKDNENNLNQLLRAGDREAFTYLYNRYNRLVYATAYRYLHDDMAADDVVQHVFMRMWEARALLRGTTDLRNYLYTIGKNYVLNEIRNRTAAMQSNYMLLMDSPGMEEPFADKAPDTFARDFRTALAALPRRQREVCSYRLEQGMSTADVARRMGVAVSTVKTLLQIGKKALRARINFIRAKRYN